MPSISQMKVSATQTQKAAMEKFQSVRVLDNHPLFDQDPEVGSVKIQLDSWTPADSMNSDPSKVEASATFTDDGTPIEMSWKTSQQNDYMPNGEMDAPVIENTWSITTDGENTHYSSSYYGPTMYGEFVRSTSQTAIMETSTGALVDFSQTAY